MGGDWRPTAPLSSLRRRAALLADIRSFFAARGVLEVETPVLAAAAVTDLHLASLETRLGGALGGRLFLQTSPEYAMKRLLAAGSGPIYQVARAFRDDERGRRHNPEFTLLEWYRPGFDLHALMDEMEALLSAVVGTGPAERLSYRELFLRSLAIDPHRASVRELEAVAASRGLEPPAGLGRDDLLNLLLSLQLEPELGRGRPTFLYDYPATQAALARLRPGAGENEPTVAERFEVYLEGIELANGFHELADAAEQRRRFEADLRLRQERGVPAVPIDERLLAALEHGLPDCAGVALGIDRLLMIALGASTIDEVLAFPVDRA